MKSELFQSKAKRDERARELKSMGMTVKKSSVRNQLLHPQYVEDWQGELETGFGNTQYATFFGVLYEVRVL